VRRRRNREANRQCSRWRAPPLGEPQRQHDQRQHDRGGHPESTGCARRARNRYRCGAGGASFGNPAQLADDIARILPALVRILRQARRDDAIERGGSDGLYRGGQPGRLGHENGGDDARGIRAVERFSARNHLVHDATERPDVGTVIRILPLDLLGRHVMQRAENGAVSRQLRRLCRRAGHSRLKKHTTRRVCGLREAEVQQLRLWRARASGARFGQHDVGGLQVAVNDAGAMGLVERVADLCRDRQRLLNRHRAACDPLRQRFPRQQLHDQKSRPIVLPDVVERADVGVRDLGDRARFAVEPFAKLRIGAEGWRKDLQGNGAFEARVARRIDLAHPTRADCGLDLIGTETSAG
jgi:hypothetical protein